MAITLFKHLDFNGGLAMLEHHNLQFTNTTKFNDPFDCHPALFDYSHIPERPHNWPPADFLSSKGENDMENLRNSTWMCCLSGEVKYKDILQKPDYFKDHPSWDDLLLTKAKDWEHEQEVRIITKDPVWIHAGRDIPDEFKKDEVVDWKEIRHYVPLSSDCFESVFLGVNMLPRNKTKIIDVAKKLNPNIEIYQMTLDPEALRLKEEPVNI